MQKKLNWVEKRQSLRSEAEVMLSNLSPAELTAKPAEVLVHELLVHKVELEMQIEELRRAHLAMEEARDRYVDLYDFAPVGYFTISREGLISEINLTGATLLGVERSKLINRRFAKFISPHDQDRWQHLFWNIMKQADMRKQTFALEMTRADGSVFLAHLEYQRRESADLAAVLRIALSDIGKYKQAEADMRDAASLPEVP